MPARQRDISGQCRINLEAPIYLKAQKKKTYPEKRRSSSSWPQKLYKFQVPRPKTYISQMSGVIDLKMASVLISQVSTAVWHLGAKTHQPEGMHHLEGTNKKSYMGKKTLTSSQSHKLYKLQVPRPKKL